MLSLDTAYRSFGGEVQASSTPTICRLPDPRRHQLSAIARFALRTPLQLDAEQPLAYHREAHTRPDEVARQRRRQIAAMSCELDQAYSIRYSAEKGAAQYQYDGAVETREELFTTFSFEGPPDTTRV